MKSRKNVSFFKSVENAASGFVYAVKRERNLKIDMGALLFVMLFAYDFGLSRAEAAIVFFAAALVICAELFNTSIENGLDAITTNYNESIKHAKDICAAAVGITALGAVICAVVIFGDAKRLLDLFEQFTTQPVGLIKYIPIIIYEAVIIFGKDKDINEK